MSTRHSGRQRASLDFYVEPAWADAALFATLPNLTTPHDPCCGLGTIVDTAQRCGITPTGADIVDRAGGRFPVRDFLTDPTIYPNIVSNPPFRPAARIAEHALAHVPAGGLVALLVPLNFLASQKRHALFTRPECCRVLVLSRRPSMPPGEVLQLLGETIRGNGSTDFCWIVWQRGFQGPARLDWSLSGVVSPPRRVLPSPTTLRRADAAGADLFNRTAGDADAA